MSVVIPVISPDGEKASVTLPNPVVTPAARTGALRLPANVRLRGMNFTFGFYNSVSNSADAGQWVNFQWDQWWRPQLDDAAAIGNCVNIWGSTIPVGGNHISLSTYLARWNQVLDYAAAKGLYVYPRGGALERWGGVSDNFAVSLYTSWASMLRDHPHVVGVDLTNEAWVKCVDSGRDYNATINLLGKLKDAVNASGLPAANSSRGIESGNGSFALDVYQGVPQAPFHAMGDFIDWHIYNNGAEQSRLTAVENSNTAMGNAIRGKDMIVGEFGVRNPRLGPNTSTYYTQQAALMNSKPNYVGGTNWACWDFSASTDWQTGLYALNSFPPTTRTKRSHVSAFQTLSMTR